MSPILIDLLILLILGFCIWQGYRKGLILTVGGVIIIFISAIFACLAASSYAQPLSESLYPIMRWVADDTIEEVTRGKGRLSEINDRRTLTEITEDTYEKLGIHSTEADKMVDMALDAMSEAETKVQDAIAGTLLYAFSYMLLCVFGFVLFMVGFTLLLHFIASVVKLPVLNRLDKVGGLACGLLYGLLIVSAIGWGARFLGIIIDPDILSRTVFLKLFMNVNLLSGILGF